MNNKSLKYDLCLEVKDYPIEIIRYASYIFSKDFWILINEKEKQQYEILLKSKNSESKLSKKTLQKRLVEEIHNELVREKIFDQNKEFRKYIIKKAILYTPSNDIESDYSLTPEEQKELEELIREAEMEIKKEQMKKRKNGK